MTRYRLSVPEMSCAHCEARITKALEELELDSFSVDLAGKTVTVETDDVKRVIEALDEAGYDACQKDAGSAI